MEQEKEMIIENVKMHIGESNLVTHTNKLGHFIIEVDMVKDTVGLHFFKWLYQEQIHYFGINRTTSPYRAIIIFGTV